MVNNNSKPNHENTCLKCGNNEQTIDRQAVKIKLTQANKSIESALEVCDGLQIENLSAFINCAQSYLFEASNKAGNRR